MNDPTSIAFACAHLCDERLFSTQRAALAAAGHRDCRVFVFREHDTLAAMADALLAATPPQDLAATVRVLERFSALLLDEDGAPG